MTPNCLHSPKEVDFGSLWTLDGDERSYPRWRVSWVESTGELYAIQPGRPDTRLKLGHFESRVAPGTGHSDKALTALEEALCLARPGSYMRVFLNEGQLMKLLLPKCLEHVSPSPVRDYAAYLLSKFDAEPNATTVVQEQASPLRDPSGSSEQALIEPLTPRELEVLQLICITAGLPAAVVGAAMLRGVRVLRPLLISAGALLAGVLLLLMTDLTLLVLPGYTPYGIFKLLTGAEFGQVYLEAFSQWTFLHQLLCLIGGFLWLAATVSYARRSGDACLYCGRRDGPEGWNSPDKAAR